VRATLIDGEGLLAAPGDVLVLVVWGLIGLAVAVRVFRWEPREV
jgi:hypothetical protein